MSLFNNLTESEKSAIGEADSRTFHLSPCPTPGCGSRRLYVGRHQQSAYVVECLDCGCRSVDCESLEEAIANWGTDPCTLLATLPRRGSQPNSVALAR